MEFTLLLALCIICPALPAQSHTWDFGNEGGVADNSTLEQSNNNRDLLGSIFKLMQSGDTFYFPNKTYWFNGGVYLENLSNVTIIFDGSIKFQNIRKDWPVLDEGDVEHCFNLRNIQGLTVTSSGVGVIDGRGPGWWGYIQYVLHEGDRPKLWRMDDCSDILMENLFFKDPPEHAVTCYDCENMEARYIKIEARRNNADRHGLYNLGALNTDGFDLGARNVWIHHVDIWCDDDTICVKPRSLDNNIKCSENMLFEHVQTSGLGLTIGAVYPKESHSCIRNITFRHAYLHHTVKGIYIKSMPESSMKETGEITNILYENITMDEPSQWPIWIGPQQAIYPTACGLFWPYWDGRNKGCPATSQVTWTNITLKDIYINSPRKSPGVILGNETNPMELDFINVVVNNPGMDPWGEDYYNCKSTVGVARGSTWPVPSCLQPAKNCEGNKLCLFGYYCDGGVSCEICPAGYYCGDGRGISECPGGRYSEEGARSVDDCFKVTEVSTVTSQFESTTEELTTRGGSKLPVYITVLCYLYIFVR